ncbi:hypothetical protein PTKIN_Ptkin14bG0039300 [Pterospermum kingtungense]
MEKTRKKLHNHNPLGKHNWVIPTTDKEKFFHISLPLDKSIIPKNSHKKTVLTCRYGWLLISQETQATKSYRSYQFSLWNPNPKKAEAEESSKVIDLPPLNLKPNQRIKAGTLLSPPSDPGSMVLLLDHVLRYFIIYKFDNKQWTKRWFSEEINQNYIAHCDGKLYVASDSYSLMSIEETTSPKVFKLRPLNIDLPSASSPSILRTRSLLDFCGQLCAVEVAWGGGVNHEDVVCAEIWKLEHSGNRMNWTKVKSAEGHAFFISENYAFSCPENEPEIKGGCIYLYENKKFYSVNIEDQSISVSLPLEKLLQQKKSPFLAMHDFRICNSQAKSKHTNTTSEEEGEEIVIEENSAQTKGLRELPFDILEWIAKNLYLIDYLNFRSACNTFRRVAPSIKWREASFNLQSQLSPWLVFPESNSSAILNFIDPYLGGRYLIKFPEYLLDTQICYSKDGWLLMCNPDLMFFYHPFKKEPIKLSQTSRIHNFSSGYGLSSSPTAPDFILVGSSEFSIYYFCQREGEWNEYEFPDIDFEPNYNNPVYFDGAFYFLGRNGKLGVFRWDDGQVSWKILTGLESPCKGFSHNYLLECSGNLVSVFVIDQLLYIYKLDFTPAMAWERVTSLGNHALFVSPFSSFSVIPNSSYMENKVYFRKLHGMDIVYYCLGANKFYTCGNREVVADFYNTTEFLFSTWIEPRWQL